MGVAVICSDILLCNINEYIFETTLSHTLLLKSSRMHPNARNFLQPA